MFQFPDLNQITILGPFWSAQARVLRLASPAPTGALSLPFENFTTFALVAPPENLSARHFQPATIPFRPVASPTPDLQTVLGADSPSLGNFRVGEFTFPGAPDLTQFSYRGRMRLTNGSLGAVFLSRIGQADERYYVLRGDNGQRFELQRFSPSSSQTLVTSDVIVRTNTWFRFQIDVAVDAGQNGATHIQIKIFRDGDAVPAASQIDFTDACDLARKSGSVGVYAEDTGNQFFAELTLLSAALRPDLQLLRRLFVDPVSFAPRSVIALCRVSGAQLIGVPAGVPAISWSRPDALGVTPSRDLAEAEIVQRLASAELNVFLLQSDPTNSNLFTCLAGELDVSRFAIGGLARASLYTALGLQDPGATSTLLLHSGGMSIQGRADLLWQTDRVEATYLLTRIPPAVNTSSATFRLTIELGRTTADQRSSLVAAWRRFNEQLNPEFPLLRAAVTTAIPTWVTLEAPNPISTPPVFWLWTGAPWAAGNQVPPVSIERGQLNLLLTDQKPYNNQNPPTSLAKVIPNIVTVARDATPPDIVITFSATPDSAPSLSGSLTYAFNGATGAETLTLANAEVAYDPTGTAQALRGPEDTGAILWAFLPLEDGWAQLPVANLTEKIYLDKKLARQTVDAQAAPPALIQGAVSFGNDITKVSGEQSWDVTVVDSGVINGRWQLKQSGRRLAVASINMTIASPSVVIEGLCWFGTGKPTAQDALPDLDDWVSGLQSVVLKSVNRQRDLFPSPLTFLVNTLPLSVRKPSNDVLLGPWSFRYQADKNLVQRMVTANVLPGSVFRDQLPLVWRRRQGIPGVQALPMTQSQSPPNYPSPSRQLTPSVLTTLADTPGGIEFPTNTWTFGVADANGAAQYPVLSGIANPAKEWAVDLPLVSLSFPGVVFEPDLTSDALSIRYRYDLPYTDQIQALAQVPKTAEQGNGNGVQPVAPLVRETFAQHWARLSTLASLAAVDVNKTALAVNGSTAIENLIEPLVIQPGMALDLANYPGTLRLNGGAINKKGDETLEGLSGSFTSGTNTFQVTSGSMSALPIGGSYRDQRGLSRSASRRQTLSSNLIRTSMGLEVKDQPGVPRDLVSMLSAVDLSAGGTDRWAFWCRDLPVATSNTTAQFVRQGAANPEINDPEARSRDRNFLHGYEWRLGSGRLNFLPLFGLQFFPLTLEQVTFIEEELQSVEVIGRLQLPTSGQGELTDVSNGVRVVFTRDATAGMILDRVELVRDTIGQWPLGGPQLFWKDLSLDRTPNANALVIGTMFARFFLLDEEWSIRIAGPIRFTSSGAALSLQATGLQSAAGQAAAIVADSLTVGLGLSTGVHTAVLGLAVSLGQASRPVFNAGIQLDLVTGTAPVWKPQSGDLFSKLNVVVAGTPRLILTSRSIQFSWTAITAAATVQELQLFPGMHVQGNGAPGFACFTFDVIAPAQTGTLVDVRFPGLQPRVAFVETALQCGWGQFLQSTPPTVSGPTGFSRVFGSSAGQIAVGYTAQFSAGSVQESFLLNGFLEVRDLISWPKSITFNEQSLRMTLPAIRVTGDGPVALEHIRHTIRILLNQHSVGQDLLQRGSDDVLFTLADGKTWQFLAVVEHQLVNVAPRVFSAFAFDGDLKNDVRWTTPQEVRLMTPASMRAFLGSLPSDQSAAIARTTLGYSHPELKQRLLAELDRLPANTLMVEASAPHFVSTARIGATGTPAKAPSTATTLQVLPIGTQRAIPTVPSDFAFDATSGTEWLLLTTPFLGRMQAQSRDDLRANETAASVSLLRRDPITVLQRGQIATPPAAIDRLVLLLANWADNTSIDLPVSNFDRRLARSFAGLDTAVLEENWFRLQNLPPEPASATLPSVMATLQNTPARLGRPVALRTAFDGLRNPADLPAGEQSGAVVWRRNSLLILEAGAPAESSSGVSYAFHLVGLQLQQSRLLEDTNSTAPVRRPAATLIPIVATATTQVVIDFIVSPYLGLDFVPAAANLDLKLVDSELLCIEPVSGKLLPVADKLWDKLENFAVWARETHDRLCPESPVAVLRLREVLAPPAPSTTPVATVTTQFAFTIVDGIEPPKQLVARTFQLRSTAAGLRFREAQYGGLSLPQNLLPFEMAPPQLTGVQPLYLNDRGWSGLRISVVYAKDGTGLSASGSTLWWQAPQHAVQFRSSSSGLPSAGLPQSFRAPAIKSLRPVMTTPPLPSIAVTPEWQRTLPGSLRYILTGNRAGAMLAMRHQLIRQSGLTATESPGQAVVCASVPVQHRMPRPTVLPENTRPTARITKNPADDVFFAGPPEFRLQAEVTSPAKGLIDGSWDGRWSAKFSLDVDPRTNWNLEAFVTIDGTTIAFGPPFPDNPVTVMNFSIPAADKTALSRLLGRQSPGHVIWLSMRVKRSASGGFFQTMRFPFRIGNPRGTPLPLEPFFVTFEDPEYNRQLASSPAQASRTISPVQGAMNVVKLATDRKAYNPDSTVAVRWNWDGATDQSATLVLSRVDSSGVVKPLITDTARAAEFKQLNLASLRSATGPALRPGDVLQLKLTIGDAFVQLSVDIVAQPVTPATQAAYGLLRRIPNASNKLVECVRFAWDPNASRIELVSPDDLEKEVVRRRAVFQWTDTGRTGRLALTDFRIQKIAPNGSTHVPEF